MDDEVEQQFNWISKIKRGFLKSFSSDYEVGTLELLQKNITDEILEVIHTYDLKRGKLLFQCIDYFYYLFCRKWYQRKKFSSYMEDVWVHIMFSFLKIGLFLSKGKKNSKCINQVLTAIKRFPGGKNLVYDALLSVNCLNKKYQPVYGSILMCLLVYMSSFVPLIIKDPADYLKMCLLFRRLKVLIKDPAEKLELQMKASKIRAPSTLSSWLLSHGFSATWMKKVPINLQINIFKKIKGAKCENEVVETIRKILLPGICTEKKSNCERPHFGLNEVDQHSAKKKYIPDNFNSMSLCVTDTLKKVNYVNLANDDQIVINDKDFSLNESDSKIKNEKESKNCADEDGRKQIQLEKSIEQQQNAFLWKKESGAEFKSKNKKLQNSLFVTSDGLSLLKDTSKFSETTKNREKSSKKQNAKESDCNSTEIKLITNHESAADKLPIIVEEINASEFVSNKKECQSKLSDSVNVTASCSVTKVKHDSSLGWNFSESEKSKPTETELLNSNFETEPTPCITKSDAVEFHNTCDSGLKHTSSNEKSENICINEELLSETNSRMEEALKNHTSNETDDACIGISNSYQDGQILCVSSVSDPAYEKEFSLPSCKQTNVNNEECSSNLSDEEPSRETQNLISSNPTSQTCELLDNQVTEPLKVKTEDPHLSVKNQTLIESQNLGVKTNNIEIETRNCSIEINTPNTYNSFNDINSLNTSTEAKITNSVDEAKTPNSSAANGLMENVLKLVELASSSEDESIRQNILRGYIPSTVKNLSLEFLSCMTSKKNEKPVKCLTFMDISTENDSNRSEIRSAYHASESPEFLKYRDVFNDQDDVSKVTFLENKSILKLSASTPSDSNNDTEDEESDSSCDCSSHVSFSDDGPLATNSNNNYGTCIENEFSSENTTGKTPFCKYDECDTKELQSIKADVYTENKTSKEQMLNPIVYLGRRCDIKTSVNSNVSPDLSPILDVISSDKKINEREALLCEQIPLTVNQSNNAIKVIIQKPEEIENEHSDTLERHKEISKEKNVQVEIQPSQKEVEEFCLPNDQEMNVSAESQEPVEYVSKLSEDIRSNKCKDLTVSKEDQELIACKDVQQLVKLTSEKHLSQDQGNTRNEKDKKLIENRKESFMLSLSMKLRKRPDLVAQTEKSALVNEDCSMLNQNSSAISGGRNLRNRNPCVSSNQKVSKRESDSQNMTKRSSKRLKKEVNVNLGFDFSELSLNSPKMRRSKQNDSSNENSSEFVEDNTRPPTKNLVNSCRRLTRASIISSNKDSIIKDQDIDSEGYNLRSRKPVILPGKLKF